VTVAVGIVVLTAGFVAEATGGHLVSGPRDRVFASVSTDTRTLQPGALFIALRGDRFDGHGFVGAAIAAGATGLLVSERPDGTGDASVVVVRDTLAALHAFARAVRRAAETRVIAITGSAGKTTTKELTAEVLSTRYRVFRNRGNLNNHIGLPLSLLELKTGPDVAVVELGMNHEGEIRTLVGIAEPNVRVWTNVGDAHIGHFGSREAVARAKAEILEGADAETLVVANADDALIATHLAGTPARVITFGERAVATVRAVDVVDRGFDGISARVTTPEGAFSLDARLPGRLQLGNILAAVAVGLQLGVSPAKIAETVGTFTSVARRGAATPLPGGGRLVDDSYNASPAATAAMLAALGATATRGRRIAVIGEMLELGASARGLHRACGEAATRARVDALVVIGGPDADGLVEGALAAGLSRARVHRFATSAEAAPVVAGLIGPGDLVLVKGSRGTRTDLVVDRLKEVA
jgi:UDP-N-acetylmuramoyl-tripeptide--D-alanyl-D-alanine ligase